MANPGALKASIQKAVAAGIPVITINSGLDQSKAFGAITHVGQDEGIAGKAAGDQAQGGRRKKMICVIHEAGNVGLEQRCAGAKRRSAARGRTCRSTTTPPDAQATMKAKLLADKAVDAVLTLSGRCRPVATQAVGEAQSQAKLATFDVSTPTSSPAVQSGDILFSVDQQPYLQGYLPVVMLALSSRATATTSAAACRCTPARASSPRRTPPRSEAAGRNALSDGRPGEHRPAESGGRAAGRSRLAAKVLRRPEVGAFIAAVMVFVFFSTTSRGVPVRRGHRYLAGVGVAFGIMAVAVALLMIGGEFDLSAGTMVGTAGLMVGVLTTQYGA